MDGLVFLARGLGHDLHTRVQNLFAGHHELRVTAAEQLREHAPEMAVHLLECGGQQLAGFAVNRADRVFQRGHGFLQIGVLRIQKSLALTGHGQFFGCSQIDRAHGGNRLLQALDLGLQCRQAHAAIGQTGRQCVQVRFGLRQETIKLLVTQARGLLFELEVGDALAQGLQLALQLQAALVAGAQGGGQSVVAAALRGQSRLALQLQGQCGLQAGACRRVVELQQLGLRSLQLLLQGGTLLGGGLGGAGQFGQTRLHAALGKLGFLRLPLQRAVLVAPLGELAPGVEHLVIQRRVRLLGVPELFVQGFKPAVGQAAPGAQRVQLGLDFAQIGVQLGSAAAGLLGQLGCSQ